jgi:hypothetical protein
LKIVNIRSGMFSHALYPIRAQTIPAGDAFQAIAAAINHGLVRVHPTKHLDVVSTISFVMPDVQEGPHSERLKNPD